LDGICGAAAHQQLLLGWKSTLLFFREQLRSRLHSSQKGEMHDWLTASLLRDVRINYIGQERLHRIAQVYVLEELHGKPRRGDGGSGYLRRKMQISAEIA
jgi:hypothetical protein